MSGYWRELATAIEAGLQAGEIHRRSLESTFTQATKTDGTPVTTSDVEANTRIVNILAERFPDDAILAEESPDPTDRLSRPRVWLVDPLDGTRDFIAGTGEFTVHIALAVHGVPVVAVVYQPVSRRLFHATAGGGAFESTAVSEIRLRVSERTTAPRIGVSRHARKGAVLGELCKSGVLGASFHAMGAATKLMAVASGALEGSVALGPVESEWDTCAPELIITEAGGRVTDLDGEPLRYNQRDVRRRRGVLATNGVSHRALLKAFAPFQGELS
jgi:3'(2'), 5'-bisphosphate nucleotidase